MDLIKFNSINGSIASDKGDTRGPWHAMAGCSCLVLGKAVWCLSLLTPTRPLHREGNGTPLKYFCLENPMDGGAWWAAVHAVAKSRTRLNNFTFTFQFHAIEKEMATHSSVLTQRIPGTGEPAGLPSMWSHRVGLDWSDLAAKAATSTRWPWARKFHARRRSSHSLFPAYHFVWECLSLLLAQSIYTLSFCLSLYHIKPGWPQCYVCSLRVLG